MKIWRMLCTSVAVGAVVIGVCGVLVSGSSKSSASCERVAVARRRPPLRPPPAHRS